MALNPSLAAPVPVGALVPRVATVNVNHADHVHRLIDERPTMVGMPRHEDHEPFPVEALHLNGITLGIEPVGVSGGVGGGVEENFKMHLVLSFACSLGVALKQYRSLETGETAYTAGLTSPMSIANLELFRNKWYFILVGNHTLLVVFASSSS